MKNEDKDSKFIASMSYEQSFREQILYIASNTTPLQRLRWVDEKIRNIDRMLPNKETTKK